MTLQEFLLHENLTMEDFALFLRDSDEQTHNDIEFLLDEQSEKYELIISSLRERIKELENK